MPQKLTTEEFVSRSNKIHDNLYNYCLVNYINNRTKVDIICNIHGVFSQKPIYHLNGSGCPECFGKFQYTLDEFIEKSNIVHDNKYNYDKFIYINSITKGIIICNLHGDFEQLPSGHLRGKGCDKCAKECTAKNNTLTINEFIEKANIIHNNKYDYSKSIYVNNITDIIIICKTHGEFIQKPAYHLDGCGCSKCINNISKMEIAWLNTLNVPEKFRHQTIKIKNKNFFVDAFDDLTNTVYEFYGDFWHGNPIKFNPEEINSYNHKTFGELYNNTIQREILIKEAGYKIISIWENDFKIK